MPIRNRLTIIIAILLIGAPTLAIAADFIVTGDNIHRGIRIGANNVGMMTMPEAQRLISAKAYTNLAKNVPLRIGTATCNAIPRNIGATIDSKAALKRAYDYGRNRPFYINIPQRLLLWIRPVQQDLPIKIKTSDLNVFCQNNSGLSAKQPKNFQVAIKDGQPFIVEGANGQGIDVDELERRFGKALSYDEVQPIDIPFIEEAPDIGQKAALDALRKVQTALAGPITLTASQNKSINIDTKQIASFLDIKEDPKKHRIDITFDAQKIETWLTPLLAGITTPPIDAKFEVKGAEVNIIPSKDGTQLDTKKTVSQIEIAASQAGSRTAFVSLQTVQPKLTTTAAESMGIKERIGLFKTDYDPRASSRVHNIHLLASFLDGQIVAPDEIFGFNERLGPRTAARGFEEAPVIINGELIPALGGGICQVGTTLFNAVFFTGLDVVERHNHSFYISHYPAGRDATISYGSADLKFRNDSGNHILVKAWTTPSSLTIAIYGTAFGAEVSFTQSSFSNFRDFTRKDVPDPNLDVGTEKVDDQGISGRDITVKRTVKVNGKTLHNDTFFSRYTPKKQIVRVGIRQPAIPQAPPVTEVTTSSLPGLELLPGR